MERYLDGTPVPPHMQNLRFVPWPLPKAPKKREVNDPSTWRSTGGFVSDARFVSNPTERVIKRTNRATTRKWRALGVK